jgi:hypothetical protein
MLIHKYHTAIAGTFFVLCLVLFPYSALAVTFPFPLRAGGGGTNSYATGSGEMYIQNDLEADGKVYFAGLNTVGSYGEASSVACVRSSGELVKGYIGTACDTATDGDIAEWYDTESDVRRGDIVAATGAIVSRTITITDPLTRKKTDEKYTINTPVLSKAEYAFRNRVLGVIATQPAQIIGADILPFAKNPLPLGITGHVPVRMTLEGGAIQPGDPITVSRSTPGAGMRASESERIIGYALEPFSETAPSSDGMIEVTVNVHDAYIPAERTNRMPIKYQYSIFNFVLAGIMRALTL